MTPGSHASSIDSLMVETRVFPPPEAFSRTAHIQSQEQYEALWNRARDDPDGFWSEQASRVLNWTRPWDRVLEWNIPWAKWFVGGQLNASYNCLDRHCAGPRKDKSAIIWEGEPGDRRVLKYQDLHREVIRFAQVLKSLGIQKGDMVTLYMPMVPETIIAMLACARLGAPHMVVFAGYSGESMAERIRDCHAKLLITADGGYRRGKIVHLKEQADVAACQCPSIQHLVVLRRTGKAVPMLPGRDLWWHDLMATATNSDADCPPEPMDSEHPLFVLYTSGSTGKPKGSLHTTGGYLLGTALTTEWVFDLKEDDVLWCTADIGWITGHSYTVYGPLALGATVVMYEGAPNYPDEGRFWKIVQDYRVSILYTSPTAIRAFMRAGERFPKRHDLSSLRLLGTVGEPINPEAWMWYYEVIGGSRCPVVDTWWQTETGAIMISALPGAMPGRPGSVSQPLPGVFPMIVDQQGHPVPPGNGGYLVLTKPWPSMLRTLYGDEERYNLQYWKVIPGMYYTGDGARCDAHGNYWILGRVDDVINVSGHRLSTMELENAVASHPAVSEAAVVGRPDERRGQAITVFVTLQAGFSTSDQLRQDLREHVVKAIGALARPDDIRFADALPKTRSGKVMRRLLRDIATGHEATGDITTLEDLHVLFQLRGDEERTDKT